MKGLIIKDLIALKSILKTIIIVVVLFTFIGITSGNTFLVTYAAVYAAIMPLNLMAYDESCRFNRFAQILPVTNTQLVLARYAAGFVICLSAALVSVAGMLISDMGGMEGALTSLVVPLLYQTFTIPVMYKWGVEKSRYITMAAFLIPFAVIMFMDSNGTLTNAIAALENTQPAPFIAAIAVVMIVMYIGSIFLSVKIVKNKEW
ncbi:MAG: ABC-2 transporter permease [Ruminococcaceae bacterium]|nr:ABC-2 transporter permease [Oscillospiraceae bacterium]